jgi:hypothetical protein
MSNSRKTVWVLGAGFSAPLGAPLLATMLSKTSIDAVRACYGGEARLWDPAARIVRRLYHWGRNWPEGLLEDGDRNPGQKVWGDAEEFLHFLDTAARRPGGPAGIRLAKALDDYFDTRNLTPNDLRFRARRWLAAECCAFLKEAVLTDEHWQPYVNWAQSLAANDTIVTFNYDRVVELTDPPHVMVIRPGHDDDIGQAREAKCCPLLKLHGSVDWSSGSAPGGDGVVVTLEKDPDFAVSCPDDALVIATPGPSKAETASQYRALWDVAEEAIRAADVIVFLGFRFPPSDSDARRRLLGAVRVNTSNSVTVHIVVGPPGEHSQRLEALLKFMRPPTFIEAHQPLFTHRIFDVRVEPLYAQDFLTVYPRQEP